MYNLYGTAMSEPLLERKFTLLSTEQVENFDIMNVLDDWSMGFVLEVDVDYPHKLHDSHSNYPLCCERHLFNFLHTRDLWGKNS